MKTDTHQKIVEYIKEMGRVTPSELVQHLAITPQAIHRQLNKLVSQKKISKTGRPPKVYYSIVREVLFPELPVEIDQEFERVIEDHFVMITPIGEFKPGVEGFMNWCGKYKLPLNKTAAEYQRTVSKYEAFKTDGIINGDDKFKQTFETVHLDKIFYLDFYAIERFGKTKLGQWLLYAKQGQNQRLIQSLAESVKPMVDKMIEKYQIDGVGFIPPTIKRDIQFMKEIEKYMKLSVRKVSIVKLQPPVIVAQKTLNKLNDRIENARNTIVVNEKGYFNNILLLDDAIGSGATLNETAQQIRLKNICDGQIIGLAITGSFKGFEVISEV